MNESTGFSYTVPSRTSKSEPRTSAESARDVLQWWKRLPEPSQGQLTAIVAAQLRNEDKNSSLPPDSLILQVIVAAAIEVIEPMPRNKMPDASFTRDVTKALVTKRMQQWWTGTSDMYQAMVVEDAYKACGVDVNTLSDQNEAGVERLIVKRGAALLLAKGAEASPTAEGFTAALADDVKKLHPDDLKKMCYEMASERTSKKSYLQ